MKAFRRFRLDTAYQCLWRRSDSGENERLPLKPKSFAMLRYLVDHAGRLVTQDELLDAVWPDTHVHPGVLKRHMFDIRNALGDDAMRPVFIETLPRRGYQFIAPVEDALIETAELASGPERFVGRHSDLGELDEYLSRALEGHRQIVFVIGEPGAGKTTLVDEFQRQVRSDSAVRHARGQCVEGYGGREAYYPMLDALGKLCRRPGGDSVVRVLASYAPTWLVQFPALVTREQRETLQRELLGATRERMLREIGEALETITATTPLVLVLEDLQWVDPSTVDLISALARGRTPTKLMLIGTYRPMGLSTSEDPLKGIHQDLLVHQLCHEIALEPLKETDIAEYMGDGGTEASLPTGLAGLVHRHSEGNPLFMVAALEHMTQRGFILRENGNWKLNVPLEEIDLEVPENLRRMIDAQIEHLTEEEQRALEVASVSGTAFSSRVCAPAANLDEKFGELCEGLSRRDLMVRPAGSQEFPDGVISERYEFVHALYREVFYARQAASSRAKLHLKIGEQLEGLFSDRLAEVAAELAHHFEEGGDWTRAFTHLRLVADNAGRRYAHYQAAAILKHALGLVSKLPESERAKRETELLTKLGSIYVVAFDIPAAVEIYEEATARAAHYNLIDLEVRALVDMAYALGFISSERCLSVLGRALELSAGQKEPVMRARTCASCLVRRIWAGGWNAGDAEECRKAIAVIRKAGDPFVLALHMFDYNFIQLASSEYREAQRNAIESLPILLERIAGNPYFSSQYRLSQYILPWSLLFLAEWGEALREVKTIITMADKNGDSYRVQTARVYLAWLHLQALDFAGAVEICDSVLPFLEAVPETSWRRLCLILAGSAQTELGNYERALEHLAKAGNEMDRQTVIHDWYRRMQLESARTELWLAKRDLQQARSHAEELLRVTHATAEKTWQALAWEANARVAVAENDLEKARDCITKALLRIEGCEVPLAAWRVHATGADLSEQMGNSGLADYHCQLSRATIIKISNSLETEEPLRKTLLSAPMIRRVLETPHGQ
jgi:DNA-binding winged helix-turn-helix (wHTH) protein/tetratricopeptide (TPR) repeat protein